MSNRACGLEQEETLGRLDLIDAAAPAGMDQRLEVGIRLGPEQR